MTVKKGTNNMTRELSNISTREEALAAGVEEYGAEDVFVGSRREHRLPSPRKERDVFLRARNGVMLYAWSLNMGLLPGFVIAPDVNYDRSLESGSPVILPNRYAAYMPLEDERERL